MIPGSIYIVTQVNEICSAPTLHRYVLPGSFNGLEAPVCIEEQDWGGLKMAQDRYDLLGISKEKDTPFYGEGQTGPLICRKPLTNVL